MQLPGLRFFCRIFILKKVTEMSSKTAKKVSTVPKTVHFKKYWRYRYTKKYRGTAHLWLRVNST